MANRIEITLKTANDQQVHLESMTPEALDSFMAVISSLKAIAASIGTDTIFSITEGSAKCAMYAPENEAVIENIYNGIDLAIKGKSKDKNYTANTRIIQEQLKRIGYDYKIVYTNDKYDTPQVIPIHERLKNANKITLKRTKREYDYKLGVVTGFLNQVGGNTPNYHFDYGHNKKITISCTREEAIDIKKYLYRDINVLLLSREWDTKIKNNYIHKLIVEKDNLNVLKNFFNQYYTFEDIVEKLEYLHDFFYDQLKNKIKGIELLRDLLVAFNNENFHISELKTLLIISKPFKESELIKDVRISLLETYELISKKN